MPTVERNLIDRLREPLFDPKREFSVPWQSGMTGIVYRKDKVKREPRSVNDLFDPDYKGKVTVLRELYDTVPMVLLGMGGDPETASVDELMEAIDKVSEASSSGQIRRFTGNEYTRDLGKGDSWLVLGWSGDAIQLQADNPQIGFVQPEEGFLLWSDNMQVPIGAPHGYTAEKFMDFVYRPEIQKPITEWVNYVCPVKGVQELVERESRPGVRPPDLPHRREPGRRHRPQATRAGGGARRGVGVPAGHRRLSARGSARLERVHAHGDRQDQAAVDRALGIPAEVDRVGVAELEGLAAVGAQQLVVAQEVEVVGDRQPVGEAADEGHEADQPPDQRHGEARSRAFAVSSPWASKRV